MEVHIRQCRAEMQTECFTSTDRGLPRMQHCAAHHCNGNTRVRCGVEGNPLSQAVESFRTMLSAHLRLG